MNGQNCPCVKKNNFFFWKKVLPDLLPESFRKNILPEEPSSERRNYFFNTRAILPIHLIAGYTSNVAGCT